MNDLAVKLTIKFKVVSNVVRSIGYLQLARNCLEELNNPGKENGSLYLLAFKSSMLVNAEDVGQRQLRLLDDPEQKGISKRISSL